MVELKPCPFCGSKIAYIAKNYLGQHYVRCPDCGAVVWGKDTDETITEKQAVNSWNRRVKDEQPTVSPDEVRGVVHCEDCALRNTATSKAYGGYWCEETTSFVKPDDFCSRGKKMEVPTMRDYEKLADGLRYCDDHYEPTDCKQCPIHKECNEHDAYTRSLAADAIEELLAAVPQWVSVEEQLPKKPGRYLCRAQNIVRRSEYYTQVLNFEYGHFSNTVYFGGDATNENVTHWMPLPAPPKEVE